MRIQHCKEMFLTIVSALFLYFSFPNILSSRGSPFLIYFFLIPFLFVIEKKGLLRKLFLSFSWGCIAYGLLVSWVYLISPEGFFLFLAGLSLQILVFAMLMRKEYKGSISDVFRVSSVWVVSEFFRNAALGGFSWTIGHSQVFSPIILQVSRYAGAYGISFVIIAINAILYNILIINKNRRQNLALLLAIVISIALYSFNSLKNLESREMELATKVCTIQPNLSFEDKKNEELFDDNLQAHLRLSRECVDGFVPDIILWPETAVTDDVIQKGEINNKIATFARENDVAMLIGSALLDNQRDYNGAVLFDREGKTKESYKKRKLIPFVEYFPRYLGNGLLMRKLYNQAYVFSPGKENVRFTTNNKTFFSALICSEEAYPELMRKTIKRRNDFIVVLVNNEWFQQPAAFYLHAQFSIMNAVSFGLPIIRSTNSGLSCFISAAGKVDEELLPLKKKGVLRKEVFAKSRRTFYGEYGDIFAVLCVVFVIISLLGTKKQERVP